MKAIGYYLNTAPVQRAQAQATAIMIVSRLEHRLRWCLHTPGESFRDDRAAAEIRAAATQLSRLADEVEAIGPLLYLEQAA